MPNKRRARLPAGLPSTGAGADDSYLELAREIRLAVQSIVTDDEAQGDALIELFERVSSEERTRVAREVFDAMPTETQWSVIERLFGDDELRDALAVQRDAAVRQARLVLAREAVVRDAKERRRFDTRRLGPDEVVTLGLFLGDDVRFGLELGRRSTACARALTLRATSEPGDFRVVDDVFNPRQGYSMSPRYDRAVWEAEDRLMSHASVRVGSIVTDRSGRSILEPVLYPGARVDVEMSGELREGRLHLGFLVIGDLDVFTDE